MTIRALAYVGVETRDLEPWRSFATELLGMPIGVDDGQKLRLRMDERTYRIDIRPGEREGLAYLGLECASAADLRTLETRLAAAGVPAERGSQDLAADRGVVELLVFADPAGNRLEAFYGQEADFRPLGLTRPMDGYLTDDLGMGHAVIGVTDYAANFEFYVNTLGFRVSDTFKGFIAFLHCNPRHHSIAIVGTDEPGLRHIMLETRSIDDVGAAIDIAKTRGELTRTLGRHTNDKAVSFYVETPGGWEIEYGWSGMQMDDETAIVRQLAGPTSLWGHELVGGKEFMSTAKG